MPRTLTNASATNHNESLRFQNSCRSLFRCPRKSGRLWSGMLLRRDQWKLDLDQSCTQLLLYFVWILDFGVSIGSFFLGGPPSSPSRGSAESGLLYEDYLNVFDWTCLSINGMCMYVFRFWICLNPRILKWWKDRSVILVDRHTAVYL